MTMMMMTTTMMVMVVVVMMMMMMMMTTTTTTSHGRATVDGVIVGEFMGWDKLYYIILSYEGDGDI